MRLMADITSIDIAKQCQKHVALLRDRKWRSAASGEALIANVEMYLAGLVKRLEQDDVGREDTG